MRREAGIRRFWPRSHAKSASFHVRWHSRRRLPAPGTAGIAIALTVVEVLANVSFVCRSYRHGTWHKNVIFDRLDAGIDRFRAGSDGIACLGLSENKRIMSLGYVI